MSPIDDELRAALQGRAQALAPSPDPLAGIERRATRIRRQRVGTAVAGSVLAVAAIAAAVPALQSTLAAPGKDVPRFATSPEASPVQQASYALDPAAPWPYRGAPLEQLGPGSLETIEREYAVKRGVASASITPLFGQVYEPSQQFELVFLADAGGALRWGVVVPTESGPEFLWDEDLPVPATALAAALPGDEVGRLLVVASPEATRVEYGADDATEYAPMAELAPGVAVGPLEGDPESDTFRVTWPGESQTASAPDSPPRPVEEGGAGTLSEQELAEYALDPSDPWPFRGIEEVRGSIAIDDERLFYETQPSRRDTAWSNRPLYYGESDAGVSYLFVLHTAEGQEAVVTTTWLRGDGAAEQTEQGVEPGMKLVQAIVPTDLDDGSVMLVALGSPKAGGIVLEQPGGNRPDGIGDPGVGLWLLDKGKRDGEIVLYTEGDGLEYSRNPVDVGPGAYDD